MDATKLKELSREELLELTLGLSVSNQKYQAQIHTQKATISNQVGTITEKTQRVAWLEGQLKLINKHLFGSKSERRVVQPDNQLSIFGDLEDALETAKKEQEKEEISYTRKKAKRKEKPFRKPLPENLPREEVIIAPDIDTSELKRIGEEVTEELNVVPAQFFVTRYIRPKYIDPKDENRGVLIANMPSRPIDKGIAGASLLAYILVSKFVDHQPLYRQQQIFDRLGYPIPRSTIEGWCRQSANLIEVLYEKHRQAVLNTDYLQADESPIKVIDRNKKKNISQGYHWVYHDPVRALCLFDYRKNRSKAGPVAILQDFNGFLQTDGYTAYESFEQKRGMKLVSCLAHIRRYFIKAMDAGEKGADEVLDLIQTLYKVEKEARERGLDHAERLELRKEKSAETIIALGNWAVTHQQEGSFLPKSLMGKALYYLIGRYRYLKRIMEDGRLEIDNNLIENKIRPLALGRKNYLFAGSHEGGRRAAIMYSFFATCKAHEINPQEWLTDVLARIKETKKSQLDTLLPHNWKKS